MPDEPPAASTNRDFSVKIVSAYLRRNPVAADQLASLISTIHQALAYLGEPAAEAAIERTPAVSIRRSITANSVICLDCGWKGQMLRRHLSTAHGLSIEQYRARWNLSRDHAMTAPAYSERRSTMAKQIGLGRTRGASAATTTVPATETQTTTQPSPKPPGRLDQRRRRPRQRSVTHARSRGG